MPWHHWEKVHHSQAQGKRVMGHQQAPLLQMRLAGPQPITAHFFQPESGVPAHVLGGEWEELWSTRSLQWLTQRNSAVLVTV